MNICIGGDLDGQVIDLDKTSFKAKDVEEGKTSEYRRQPFILENKTFRFWIAKDIRFDVASGRVEKILRKPKN